MEYGCLAFGKEHAGFAVEYGANDALYCQGRWYKDERCLCADKPAGAKRNGVVRFARLLLNK